LQPSGGFFGAFFFGAMAARVDRYVTRAPRVTLDEKDLVLGSASFVSASKNVTFGAVYNICGSERTVAIEKKQIEIEIDR
jgi:hypothetical protein